MSDKKEAINLASFLSDINELQYYNEQHINKKSLGFIAHQRFKINLWYC
jgi:hypothetical protein